MYAPHHAPEPIEKIRKAQWTVENTRKTQAVVQKLAKLRDAFQVVHGSLEARETLEAAIARFKELDRGVR